MEPSQFPLFRSHLQLAHLFWSLFLKKGAIVVDATCGNGHDSLTLARLCLGPSLGRLYCIDIQKKAIEQTQALLQLNLEESLFQNVTFFHASHAPLPVCIKGADLVVYNLGYLPGGNNKDFTTIDTTTIESIQDSLKILKPGGLVSIMCYPGHPAGNQEETSLIKFCETLPPQDFFICHHKSLNRKKAPNLILISKKK